ncbi:MAG: LuxR C-terminal-related transcriptional regulator [Coriobacteriales bacterium]|jgi:LuxR family maltose regulon positive regulatory protein|nr:LuxR C-terminal-related transcriptional regulator [Coriobacteriales bacterium]
MKNSTAVRKEISGPQIRIEGRKVLRRTRLNAQFDEAMKRPVVTVIAGSGYGKSMAVYSYLRESENYTIWVQLSDNDNAPSHFWETFSQAFVYLNRELSARLRALSFPESEESLDYIIDMLRHEHKPHKCYELVLDDLHLLNPGPVFDFIMRVINTIAEGTGDWVIVIARRDIFPNTSALIHDDHLSQIDESDLAFTKSEIQEYFELIGVDASNDLVNSVYKDTEGLPFVVSLSARLLEHNPGDSGYIHTALIGSFERIIDTQLFWFVSEDLRRFLVKLSLIKHLSPDLINELDDGHKLMSQLASISSLVRYDRYMHVYRLHNLLLEYLKNKQNMLTEDERREVYSKAARWCETNGYHIDAIAYYRAMGDYDSLVNMANNYPSLIPHDIAVELLAALDQAPEEYLSATPDACVLYPRLVMTVGRVDEALRLTHEHIQACEQLPPSAAVDRMLAGFYNCLGFAGMINCPETHDYSFATYFEKALSYFGSAAKVEAPGHMIYSVGPYVLRVGRAHLNDPENYIAAVGRSAVCTTQTLRGCMHGLENLTKAEYAYFRGRSNEAENLALRSITEAQGFGQTDIEARALYLLMRIYLQMGKYECIVGALAQLDKLILDRSFPNLYLLYEIATSWLYASIGEVQRVEYWLKSDLWPSRLNDHISGLDDFAKVRYYLANKDYQALLNFTEDRSQRFGITRFVLGQLGVHIIKAICHQRLGNHKEALEWLKQSYQIAKPNKLVMLFIEFGNNMRSLASLALKTPNFGVPTEWLETIRCRSTTYAKHVAYVRSCYLQAHGSKTNVHLTSKELDILVDLSHGLSRTEISLAHGISINTVKSVLQVIYDKLGAEGALDAVRIAVAKQLI